MNLQFRVLEESDDTSGFMCEHEALSKFIRESVFRERRNNLCECYVCIDTDKDLIAGYFTLSTSCISRDSLPSKTLQKKVPTGYGSVPAILVGRLARDLRYRGESVGDYLMMESIVQCVAVRKTVGVQMIHVQAKDTRSANFYKKFSFVELSESPLDLILPISTAIRLVYPSAV